MRIASVTLLGLVLTGLSLGCGDKSNPTPAGTPTQGPPPASPTGGDAVLDGTYLLTKQEFGPIKITTEELAKDPEAKRTIVIKGNKLTHAMKKKSETWEIKLDAGKSPHEITVTETPAVGGPEEYPGIYQLDGDSLTILLGMDKPRERPKTLSPTDKTWLLVMKKK
jgi:uncharacterized protein (TIGR03067 family)